MKATALARQNALAKIYKVFSKRRVYHTLLWIIYVLGITLVNQTGSFGFRLGNELTRVLFLAPVVYFNLLYLIPNYLTDKKFLTYCFFLLGSVALATPLQVLFLYLKVYNYPDYQQYIIANQWGIFFLTLVVAGTSTILKIISDWARHQRERKELQTQNMQSELRFLKSQINPHFLFNTLNNIYALTLKKSDKAPEIVLKLSEMMRYMLYECNEKRVMLSKEVKYLKNYLDLERLRQGKNIEINLYVQGHISSQQIAPLMFIPFIENSFKHGLSTSIASGFVNIVLDVEENKIHLMIENSKPSLPNQYHKRSGGIGLVNVRRRLDLLYPNQYTLDIENHPSTYTVNMVLDLG